MNKLILLFLSSFFATLVVAQDNWEVPVNEKENLSIFMFDEDFEVAGEIIYENSCFSCHGTPGKDDYSLMIPSPGDLAKEKLQSQTDGDIFYKIKTGKGLMPGFEDAYGDDEIWNLVAFIRSFNENYVQAVPNLEGIEIPNINLELEFDENVDKLVVKTINADNNEPMQEVLVKAYIKGSFGNFLLGKNKSNEVGIAYFDVDSKMPGDSEGKLNVIVKASKGYGIAKANEKMIMVEPTIHENVIDGRHLWSVSKKAPYWLIFAFILTIVGIWGAIIYVIAGLRNLKKYS